MQTRLPRDFTTLVRLTPLLAGVLAAVAACIGALVQGVPLPLEVVGVFLVLGLVATWIARATPLRGAAFIVVLAAVVISVVYGG